MIDKNYGPGWLNRAMGIIIRWRSRSQLCLCQDLNGFNGLVPSSSGGLTGRLGPGRFAVKSSQLTAVPSLGQNCCGIEGCGMEATVVTAMWSWPRCHQPGSSSFQPLPYLLKSQTRPSWVYVLVWNKTLVGLLFQLIHQLSSSTRPLKLGMCRWAPHGVTHQASSSCGRLCVVESSGLWASQMTGWRKHTPVHLGSEYWLCLFLIC